MSTTAEVFAAMGEAVAGEGGKTLQKKFKVRDSSTNDENHEAIGDASAPFDAIARHHDGSALISNSFALSEGDAFDNKADLQVSCSEEIMMKMVRKEIQPQQAFMKGKLKIKGKMNLAMKLTAVLAATRKKLPVAKL
ncbi:hypothetical protein HJC23_000518 [Cyclotella cryptica]|uniref:SCP2 domain-containing protein n=1 Tax=Cyclotella cryptica TaxID=29204 RepID=A0ABD3NVE6_9STRA